MSVARRTIPWHAGCFTKSWEATRPVPAPPPRALVDSETPASVDQRDAIAWVTIPGAYGAGIDTWNRSIPTALSSFSLVTACSS